MWLCCGEGVVVCAEVRVMDLAVLWPNQQLFVLW